MNAYQYPAAPPSYAGTPTDPTAVMGRRTVAWIVDFLIWFLLSLFLGPTPLNPLAEYVDTGGVVGIDCQDIQDANDVASCVEIGDRLYFLEGSDVTISLVVLWILAPLAYVALMGATGRSPGMALLGVKVVNEQGDNPGFGKSFIRTVLWIVDGIPCIIPLVGFITGLTTTGHRRVGDMAAKTFVVGKAHSGPVVVPGLTTAGGAGYPTPYGPPGQQQAWGAPGPAGVGGPPGAGQPPAWGAPSAPPPGAQPGSWGTPSGGFPVPGATPSPDRPPPGQPVPPAAAPGWAPPGVRQPSGETPSGETPSGETPSPAGSPTSPTSPTSPRAEPLAPSGDSAPPTDARSDRPSAASSPTEPPRGSAAAAGGAGSAPSGESPAADAPTSREPTGPTTPGQATSGAAAAAGAAAGGATPPGESPASQSAPSSYNPQWDAARGTYIVWEPNRGKWLGWDEAAQEWKPL